MKFEQMINVSFDMPSEMITIGRKGIVARIANSSVICNSLTWISENILIESYENEECLIVANEGFVGNNIVFDVSKAYNLKVSSLNINNYYRLIPFSYNFEDTSNVDITMFIHSLRCILVEFRTHRKDTLGKTADRIEHVTVGNSNRKRCVLNYLKDNKIIYKEKHLYKVNEENLQNKGINFNDLRRMNEDGLENAYLDFCNWMKKQE